MRTLHMMLVKAFLPVFLVTILFFVLILQLVDIFEKIPKYLNNDVPMENIIEVIMLYMPKCIAYALPVAMLFAVSYTLGILYTNNELISVFGSGISLYKLIIPFLLFGILLSVGSFFFQDQIVVETFRMKNELSDELTKQSKASANQANIPVLDTFNNVVYQVEIYNDSDVSISRVIIIYRDEEGNFIKRVDADRGVWSETYWKLYNCRIFTLNEELGQIVETFEAEIDDPVLNKDPDNFRKRTQNVEEMKVEDAKKYIDGLKEDGLPYNSELTDYYNRFSFTFTPFIVALVASAIGGKFKKNILLMSLLSSLVIIVVYYVFQMVTVLLAKNGVLSPLLGAWLSFIVFFVLGAFLLRFAKS